MEKKKKKKKRNGVRRHAWGTQFEWAWEANLKRESKEIGLSLHHSPPAQDST